MRRGYDKTGQVATMKRALLTILTVLAGVVVVAGSVFALGKQQSEPATIAAVVSGTAPTPLGDLPHATLELSIYPQEGPGNPAPEPGLVPQSASSTWPFYSPSTSIQLPANSLVTITVHQYDSASTVYNPYLAQVHGTLDGTASFAGEAKTGIDPKAVAHTFTIHQFPESSQPNLYVSVPMLAVANNAPNEANGYPKPIDVTFSFVTGAPGQYVWNCEDPCGSGYVSFGGPMSQRGFMSGTVTVV